MKQNTSYFYSNSNVLLKKYRIEAPLGKGASAEVYRVTHLRLGVARALKVLHHQMPGVGRSEFNDYVSRFELEAQIGAQLNSPNPQVNLIQIHNIETQGDLLVMEMEYASGGSLAERMQKSKERDEFISISEALKIARDVAEGLAVIHARDIVHRDLKPNNILFDNKGNAKVADLGLAQVPGGPSLRSKLSAPQPHPGTPGYKSPEHANSSEILKSPSDIYCLGLVMFEMLTGRNYSYAEPGTRASELRTDVPAWLDDLLASMLAKEPEKRPWDGKKVAALIRTGMYEVEENAGRTAQIVALKETLSKSFTALKSALSKALPFLKIVGFAGIAIALLWGGSLAIPKFVALIPTAQASVVPPANTSIAITKTPVPSTKTKRPNVTPTKTQILTNTPTKTRTPTILLLPAGATQISSKDDMVMVYIPKGNFTMGTDNGYSNEGPAHDVFLDAFWIDQTEVTFKQYSNCYHSGECFRPIHDLKSGYVQIYIDMENYSNFPVIQVYWNMAKSYCEWAGKRLPTESEWEKAARGTDGRIYPWGNETASCRLANIPACGRKNSEEILNFFPVGSFPKGVSPYGVYDMIGNASEWVADWYDSAYYDNSPSENPTGPLSGEYRVLRGGSVHQTAQLTSRNWLRPTSSFYIDQYGVINYPTFRCAMDAIP